MSLIENTRKILQTLLRILSNEEALRTLKERFEVKEGIRRCLEDIISYLNYAYTLLEEGFARESNIDSVRRVINECIEKCVDLGNKMCSMNTETLISELKHLYKYMASEFTSIESHLEKLKGETIASDMKKFNIADKAVQQLRKAKDDLKREISRIIRKKSSW